MNKQAHESRPSTAGCDAGFTIIELVIAMGVFTIVVLGGLSVFSSQTQAFNDGSERTLSLVNLRYTVRTLEQDLRTLGTNVVSGQPQFVYAGRDVVAFNADYTSNVLNDISAVFIDVDAPDGQVSALATPTTLPGTAFQYPDTTYQASPGVNSSAELLMFFFEADATTPESDDFVLYRQVNLGTRELVARNLHRFEGRPFFSYVSVVEPADSAAYLDSIPDASLPLQHSIAIHGSPADTAGFALIDSIRGVRVTLSASSGGPVAARKTVSSSRLFGLPNAGTEALSVCGSTPIFGGAPIAQDTVLAGGETAIALRWQPAVDETSGERDIARYLIWRRVIPTGAYGDPLVSLPAGAAAYQYVDNAVTTGTTYQYAVSAQDCTPEVSPNEESNQIVAS